MLLGAGDNVNIETDNQNLLFLAVWSSIGKVSSIWELKVKNVLNIQHYCLEKQFGLMFLPRKDIQCISMKWEWYMEWFETIFEIFGSAFFK